MNIDAFIFVSKGRYMSARKEKQHSLNRSQLAKKLQERFATDPQKLSYAQSIRILDELFGVAEDDEKRDGIIVEHLRQEMSTSSIEKSVQKDKRTKTFRYTDLRYNKVTIPDFGTFKIAFRAARTGSHPSDQKKVDIQETFVVTFAPGKGLREAFRKGSNHNIDTALEYAQKAHKTKESIRKFKSSKE